MLSKNIEKLLQEQVLKEASSSQVYLSMANWADVKGYNGAAQFLFAHSDEERMHMLKLMKFLNERGSQATVPALKAPEKDFKSLMEVFKSILTHEIEVTKSINNIITACLKENDHLTNNFMQWYISEQMEEESLARDIIDKLEMIGSDKSSLYLFDRELGSSMNVEAH